MLERFNPCNKYSLNVSAVIANANGNVNKQPPAIKTNAIERLKIVFKTQILSWLFFTRKNNRRKKLIYWKIETILGQTISSRSYCKITEEILIAFFIVLYLDLIFLRIFLQIL